MTYVCTKSKHVRSKRDLSGNGSQGICNTLNEGVFDNVIWPIMDLR